VTISKLVECAVMIDESNMINSKVRLAWNHRNKFCCLQVVEMAVHNMAKMMV